MHITLMHGLLQVHDITGAGLLLELVAHLPITPQLLAQSQVASAVKPLRSVPCPAMAGKAR